MKVRVLISFAVVLMAIAALASDKPPEQYATIKFVVVKDWNGKPIRNAAVVLHPVDKDGKQEKGGMELKTDSEGRTKLDGVPYGKLRIQVIAKGLQTFGQDYDINQPEHEITIKMKQPQNQYSIYK
jgi:hypothetical protein